jgi:HK97 family phage major capsid protein
MDIAVTTQPSAHGQRSASEARSRLEQTENRNRSMLENRANKENRAAGTGGFTTDVPSDGGFFLQGETSVDLMTTGFNNSEVLSRCDARTVSDGTQFLDIIGIDETSRVNGSRGGGVTVYTAAELDAFTQSKTKFKKIRIEPKKLTGLYYASSEVMNNVTFLGQEMRSLFGEEFAFKCQDLVIRGTGAGEPLGILNAGCLITQAKESGQAADTIVTENILGMETKIWREGPKLVYLVNRETKPQLSTLSLAIGTGGVPAPLYKNEFYEGNRISTLNGLPCITIEQAAALGDAGDIILADFSQYITANRGDINEAMSIHVNFLYDQQTFRFIYYFEGQPRWATSVTPYKGASGAKVGPFITLAARA